MKRTLIRRIISYSLVLGAIPVLVFVFATVMPTRYFLLVAIGIAVLSVGSFFLNFEKERNNTAKTVLTAVFAALSTVSRIVFAAVPGFKPVMSMTMFAGMYLGGDAGFLVGALTALLSNFFFGQGAWTPFQMFLWGLIGLLAGVLARPLKKSKIFLCVVGVFVGVMFSMLIDVWSTVWMFGSFNFKQYFAVAAQGIPFMIRYGISNTVFLLLLSEPMRKTMERVLIKYDIGVPSVRAVSENARSIPESGETVRSLPGDEGKSADDGAENGADKDTEKSEISPNYTEKTDFTENVLPGDRD
ncbi:MAG: ECF transporter S component [Clostridia bacterium]|nr:ECF transporter S component [Clostridia bacterium]